MSILWWHAKAADKKVIRVENNLQMAIIPALPEVVSFEQRLELNEGTSPCKDVNEKSIMQIDQLVQKPQRGNELGYVGRR